MLVCNGLYELKVDVGMLNTMKIIELTFGVLVLRGRLRNCLHSVYHDDVYMIKITSICSVYHTHTDHTNFQLIQSIEELDCLLAFRSLFSVYIRCIRIKMCGRGI